MARKKSEYTVGYCKPPAEHQFKPGKSGNPKGRKAGSKSLKQLLLEESEKLMILTQDGTTKKIPGLQGIIMALKQKAVRGDIRAIRQYLQLYEKYGLDMPPPPDASPSKNLVTLEWDDACEAAWAEIDRKFRLLEDK